MVPGSSDFWIAPTEPTTTVIAVVVTIVAVVVTIVVLLVGFFIYKHKCKGEE